MKNTNLPTTQKETKQVSTYNPATAKLAKENLLKHVEKYPTNLTEENIKSFVLEGNEYLKVYQAEWKSIADLNKNRLDIEKKLKDKLVEAKNEFNKIASLKVTANSQIQFFAKDCEVGKERDKWNEYFEKYGKYTTYSYNDFEKLCNQFQLQKEKAKELERLSEFEKLLNEPTKVQSVEVKDVENVTYKTTLIVDFDKLDCKRAIEVLVANGKAEHLIDMLRIALKDSKEEINGISYVEEVTQRIKR